MLRAVLFALLLFTVPAAGATLRVSNDWGGPVDDRVKAIARLEATGTQVRITGVCASACTLYLKLPTTCVAPGARLGFHGPQADNDLGVLPLDTFNRYQRLMASHYPAKLSAWFLQGPGADMDGEEWLSARQAVAMGVPAC